MGGNSQSINSVARTFISCWYISALWGTVFPARFMCCWDSFFCLFVCVLALPVAVVHFILFICFSAKKTSYPICLHIIHIILPVPQHNRHAFHTLFFSFFLSLYLALGVSFYPNWFYFLRFTPFSNNCVLQTIFIYILYYLPSIYLVYPCFS